MDDIKGVFEQVSGEIAERGGDGRETIGEDGAGQDSLVGRWNKEWKISDVDFTDSKYYTMSREVYHQAIIMLHEREQTFPPHTLSTEMPSLPRPEQSPPKSAAQSPQRQDLPES